MVADAALKTLDFGIEGGLHALQLLGICGPAQLAGERLQLFAEAGHLFGIELDGVAIREADCIRIAGDGGLSKLFQALEFVCSFADGYQETRSPLLTYRVTKLGSLGFILGKPEACPTACVQGILIESSNVAVILTVLDESSSTGVGVPGSFQ